jgi:hypothetical protein
VSALGLDPRVSRRKRLWFAKWSFVQMFRVWCRGH